MFLMGSNRVGPRFRFRYIEAMKIDLWHEGEKTQSRTNEMRPSLCSFVSWWLSGENTAVKVFKG